LSHFNSSALSGEAVISISFVEKQKRLTRSAWVAPGVGAGWGYPIRIRLHPIKAQP